MAERGEIGGKFTIREWAMAIGIIIQFLTYFWRTAQFAENQRVNTLAVERLQNKVEQLTNDVNRNVLLEYRVAEMERQMRDLQARTRR